MHKSTIYNNSLIACQATVFEKPTEELKFNSFIAVSFPLKMFPLEVHVQILHNKRASDNC